jgi:hypothetical protein
VNEHEAMKLPAGKTCANCHHYYRCSAMFGAHLKRTECDFYPRRFIERPVAVTESAAEEWSRQIQEAAKP